MMQGAVDRGEWAPDWATHPGEHLAEYIAVRGWQQAEFARIAGLTPKLVSTILKGTNPITPETAIKLERVLGLKAQIWTNLQSSWDLWKARQEVRADAFDAANWIKSFPVKELKARGLLSRSKDSFQLAEDIMGLLEIGAPDAIGAKMDSLAVCHRQAKARPALPTHVLTWLMLGERQARAMDVEAFDTDKFIAAVSEIRTLTTLAPVVFEPRMVELCRQAGVALVFEKPISKTRLFGSARWFDHDRALIQMSLRLKTNDHFWWTFFHEAAHIILHRGHNFMDDQNGQGDGREDEADAWAEDILVGRKRFKSYAATGPKSAKSVEGFAKDIGLHPGIVVGMLQHARALPFTHLNKLKEHFDWADEEADM